jgi:hypothetical protein
VTYDDLIDAENWSGENLEMRKRMAEYLVDGSRFGAMALKTRSGSPNDVHLDKRTKELLTACMVFSYLKMKNIQLCSLDPHGRSLERPDLDAILDDGSLIGIEVADVSETRLRKHEAARSLIETSIMDKIDSDATFKEAIGKVYLSITLNGAEPCGQREIESKKEAKAIVSELIAFLQSGDHLKPQDEYYVTISGSYPKLLARGVQIHVEVWDYEPHFTVSDGASTIDTADRREEVIRVLNDHRNSAVAGYRALPTWIILLLTDTNEFFYNTIGSVLRDRPAIAPFVRGYLMDAFARVLRLD